MPLSASFGQVETDETENWNGKRKAGAESWNGKRKAKTGTESGKLKRKS